MPEFGASLKGIFIIAFAGEQLDFPALILKTYLNAELCKKAAEKVGNPNVLVNLISRRVRQLNSGGGGMSRPLVDGRGIWARRTSRCAKSSRTKWAWKCRNWSNWSGRQPKKRKKR